jgi:hypothetical protein
MNYGATNYNLYGSPTANQGGYNMNQAYNANTNQGQNNYANQTGANQNQSAPAYNIPQGLAQKENYSSRKVENSLIKRSDVIGNVNEGWTEADDYMEQQSEKFLSSEIEELSVYHYQGHIFGFRAIYRDSWGKDNREIYKGNMHMAANIAKETCEVTKMTLGFGENIVKVLVEGGEFVTYLKLVTNQGKVLELGAQRTMYPIDVLPKEHAKLVCIAGTFNICMNSIYFYYV